MTDEERKEWHRAQMREYAKAHRKEHTRRQRGYYAKHKEELLRKKRERYRQKHPKLEITEESMRARKKRKEIDRAIGTIIGKRLPVLNMTQRETAAELGYKEGTFAAKLVGKSPRGIADYFALCEKTGLSPLKLYHKMRETVEEKEKATHDGRGEEKNPGL